MQRIITTQHHPQGANPLGGRKYSDTLERANHIAETVELPSDFDRRELIRLIEAVGPKMPVNDRGLSFIPITTRKATQIPGSETQSAEGFKTWSFGEDVDPRFSGNGTGS